jgi:hypothetical protein
MSAAIHIGRLRASLNFYPVANPPRESRFRLDVRVFHKPSLEFTFNHEVCISKSAIHISTDDATAGENVVRPIGV